MTKTLIDRIREAGEFANLGLDFSETGHYGKIAAEATHAQSAWMLEALLIAVKQLEFQSGISDHKALREIAALVPGGGDVMNTEIKLNGNTDALIWAQEFVRLNNSGTFKDGIDEGLMLAWFANAIMTGFDEGKRRAEKHPPREGSES